MPPFRAAIVALAMALTLGLGAAPGSLGGPEPASAGQAPADCDARQAVYRRGEIRVFLHGETIRTYYLCSERLRRPRPYRSRKIDPAEHEPSDFSVVKRRRLFYTDFIVSTQTEVLAWVDLTTAQYREVKIPRDHEYDEIRALGPDGAIAFVTTEAEKGQRIWYAAPGRNALGTPRVLARLSDGDICTTPTPVVVACTPCDC